MSNKEYAFPLTLGTKGNNRETPGDVYGVYINKKFYSNNIHPYNVNTAVLIPTKDAIDKYGQDVLHVVIFKGVKPAEKSSKPGYRWMYKATTSTLMSVKDFIKLFGKLPTLNSGGVKINLNV